MNLVLKGVTPSKLTEIKIFFQNKNNPALVFGQMCLLKLTSAVALRRTINLMWPYFVFKRQTCKSIIECLIIDEVTRDLNANFACQCYNRAVRQTAGLLLSKFLQKINTIIQLMQ